MNSKTELFANLVSFRRGSIAQGVRAELSDKAIPEEIKNLIALKKQKAQK